VATIAVGADWTDNRPLLGFRNLLSQQGQSQYVAPEALRLILKASAAQEESSVRQQDNIHAVEPYFIILDEMNLSHVERYFADFLSSMESGEPLRLHDCPEGLNADGVVGVVPHQVKWPKNLFIIGTVNVDETTYLFSPKVLDRAHVIEFRVSWDEVSAGLSSFSLPNHERWGAASIQAFMDVSLSGHKTLSDSDHSKLLEVLGVLYSVLSGSRFVFAHRTARECLNFIAAAHALAAEGLIAPVAITDLIDSALMQKALPKLNGTAGSLGKIIEGLIAVSKAQGLVRCTEKLEAMSRQLKADQFVSFIQ
jgi:5-methylcytosine-specific restriction protein B